MRIETALLHDGKSHEAAPTMPPIHQTSAFAVDSAAQLEGVFHNTRPGYCYTRVGNPTVTAFEQRVSRVEGAIASVACASGMAAVFNAVMGCCRAGDELVASASLYGGTMELFEDLADFGVTVRYVPEATPEAVRAAITDRTRAVFAETISNPKLDVLDIAAVAEVAREAGVVFIVDNTVASPYLCRPLELGADLVVESSSKYINGGGNSISGVVCDSGRFRWDAERYPGMAKWKKMGPFAFVAKLRNGLWRDTGACLAPLNAYLNCVGLETLAVRMERQCANALALAEWFAGSGLVDDVNYIGLPGNPNRALAARQFGGRGFGAMVTVRAGSKERAFQVIDGLRYAYAASNIGDVKTLVLHPASTIFCDQTAEEQRAAGVYPDTIRISVGIESADDLIADFERVLRETAASPAAGAGAPGNGAGPCTGAATDGERMPAPEEEHPRDGR